MAGRVMVAGTIAAIVVFAVLAWTLGSPLYRYLLRRGLPKPAAFVVAAALWLIVPPIGFVMTMAAWPEKDDPILKKGAG